MSDDLKREDSSASDPLPNPEKTEINSSGGAVIMGNITLGPHARFIGRDYIENNITRVYSILPSPLDKMVVTAVLRYGGFIFTTLILLLLWLVVRSWLEPRLRYLLPDYFWYLWLMAAVAAVWFFQNWRFQIKEKGVLNHALWPTLIAVLVGGGSIAWPLLNPIAIDDDPFVIALADLGESSGAADLQPAREGAQISRRIFDKLCDLRAQNNSVGSAHCPIERNGVIVIQRVGFAADQAAALRLAKRVNADIVLWGSFESGGDQNLVKLRYTLTQTLDPIYDVDRPTIIPVLFSEVQVCTEADRNDVAADSSQLVQFIWPVTLGFNSYQQREYETAKSQLEIALKRLAEGENQLLDCQKDAVDQNKALLNFFLGRSYQWLGDLPAAEAALLAAAAEPAALISLGIGDQQQQKPASESIAKWDEAIAVLEPLRDDQAQPIANRVAAHYNIGRAYALKQDWNQAALSYADAIRLANDTDRSAPFYPGLITLGQLILRQNDLTSDLATACERAGVTTASPESCAQELFESALLVARESGVNPAWVYRNLGLTAEIAQDFDTAEDHYLTALTENPWEPILYETYISLLEDRCQIQNCAIDGLFLKVAALKKITDPLDTAENNRDQRARLEEINNQIDLALARIKSE